MSVVKCFYLNRIKYTQALTLQKWLVNRHIEDEKANQVLLLLQHYPVYTVGIRSTAYTELERKSLMKLGADFEQTNRGGLITFHGPGQLVAYPIMNLKCLGRGVRKYVHALEEVIIKLCSLRNISATRSPHTGVWVGNNKICAMGVNVQRQVTSHGLALNCNTDMSWFNHIVPCGIHGKGVTSLSECLRKNIPVEDVISDFRTLFSSTFQVECDETVFIDENVDLAEKMQRITADEQVVDNLCNATTIK